MNKSNWSLYRNLNKVLRKKYGEAPNVELQYGNQTALAYVKKKIETLLNCNVVF